MVDAPKVTDNGETKVAPDRRRRRRVATTSRPRARRCSPSARAATARRPRAFRQALRRRSTASVITKAQDDYVDGWVKKARAFFEEHVPKDVPKKVVYPFAGGDLSTALTVYPDADEITTMSLEPAGDPRTLASLKGKDARARARQGRVRAQVPLPRELQQHAQHDRGDARRRAADAAHLRPVGAEDSRLRARRAALLPARTTTARSTTSTTTTSRRRRIRRRARAEQRNLVFSNVEVQFRKPGGRIQVWRHIRANLGNDDEQGHRPGLKEDPRVVKHLEAKGHDRRHDEGGELPAVVGLVLDHAQLPHRARRVDGLRRDGRRAEVGQAGGLRVRDLRHASRSRTSRRATASRRTGATSSSAQPKRELPFRFGYYDKKIREPPRHHAEEDLSAAAHACTTRRHTIEK